MAAMCARVGVPDPAAGHWGKQERKRHRGHGDTRSCLLALARSLVYPTSDQTTHAPIGERAKEVQ